MLFSNPVMAHENYKRTLEAAKTEMGELLHQRNEIDSRIGKLAPVIEYLSLLCDEIQSPPPDLPMPSQLDLGLSDAIRLAFRSAVPESLTPTEVRDKLKASGFNLGKYANELPPIHNTIARLKEQGEIEETARPNGDRAYKWVSSLKRALLDIEPKTYGASGSLANMFAGLAALQNDPRMAEIGSQMGEISRRAASATMPFAEALRALAINVEGQLPELSSRFFRPGTTMDTTKKK
jgi:hypothetical protein